MQISLHVFSKSCCIWRPLFSHVPSLQSSLFLRFLNSKIPSCAVLPTQHSQENVFQSLISINHLSWGLQSPLWSSGFGWFFFLSLQASFHFTASSTSSSRFRRLGEVTSVFEPCPTSSAGLDEAVMDTKYCDNFWWGFQDLFCLSKSENKGYQTIWLIPALACFTSQHGCWMSHLLEYSYF